MVFILKKINTEHIINEDLLDASRPGGLCRSGASETARAPSLCDPINRAGVTRRPLNIYQSAISLQRCHAPPRDGINGATAAPRLTLPGPGTSAARVRQSRREPRLCATLYIARGRRDVL